VVRPPSRRTPPKALLMATQLQVTAFSSSLRASPISLFPEAQGFSGGYHVFSFPV